jgi:hypothetical protein
MRKSAYVAPAIKPVGSLHQLTLLTPKHTTNTPDGFSFNGAILTS